jgi:hypothetical protein
MQQELGDDVSNDIIRRSPATTDGKSVRDERIIGRWLRMKMVRETNDLDRLSPLIGKNRENPTDFGFGQCMLRPGRYRINDYTHGCSFRCIGGMELIRF